MNKMPVVLTIALQDPEDNFTKSYITRSSIELELPVELIDLFVQNNYENKSNFPELLKMMKGISDEV